MNLVGNNLRSLQISEDQVSWIVGGLSHSSQLRKLTGDLFCLQAVEREGGYEEKIRQLEQEYAMVRISKKLFSCASTTWRKLEDILSFSKSN